ncbi:TlpA family protein disulfide reductase [Chitinophaga lutea]|uniref:TlpA family protein disulfide reductase n=1 Tax=Chitinophaga lutea TaxID=2488634 RepID=A0A3N4QAH2_9BACT|nr:TlpA disulfide reductase family protein [Chitinophaga lutea]RPE08734.1 TlpA family protein disulfide reductase [Chitinophaga lutea]
MMNTIMKPALLLALMSPVALQAQKTALPKQITVQGKVKFAVPPGQPNKIWLSRDMGTGKPVVVDSTVLGDDLTYTFKIKQDHPGIYKLNIMYWDHISFWSDADVKISSRGYDTAKMKMKIPHFYFVEGSSDNNFINQMELNGTNGYLRMIEEYNEEYFAKQHKEKGGDSAWASYLATRKRYNPLREDAAQRQEVLMKIYEDRPVLIYALRSMAGTESKEKYAEALTKLDNLIKKYPWLTEAKDMKATILKNKAQAMKLQPGQPVPTISYPDELGQVQGLEQYKGKYLLIDFWASWCGPCRQAIPKVKELYAQYKDKGFDVVSVSIDTDKKAWRKAMEDEKMPWKQLLSDDKDKTMEQFQFSGIPTLYVVDPQGKIVSKHTGYGPGTEAEIKAIMEKGTTAKPAGERKVIPAMAM